MNTAQAELDGRNDGIPPGQQEGRERGTAEGRADGQRDGYRQGFDRCERDLRQQNYDRGYHDGYGAGSYDGENEGRTRGDSDGRARGQIDGVTDGQNRADVDANRDATPAGAAKGIDEANHSDAAERGIADGLQAGDREAREHAIAVDYPRGRKDVRDERFAEPIQFNDEFSQARGNLPSFASSGLNASSRMNSVSIFAPGHEGGNAQPDFRYFNPRRTYPTQEENTAYQRAYRAGYIQGFNGEYRSNYDQTYRHAFNNFLDRGCDEARRRDYREFYARGFDQGRAKGYHDAYQRAYDQQYRNAYNSVFPAASQQAYQETYPRAYNRHFEVARAAAYQQRVNEIYNANYEQARAQKFDEKYPLYAQQEYQRGRKDETQDFAERPVRLINADVTETIENGVMEPGEALRVRFDLRNFANGGLEGKDIKVRIEALDAGAAVITTSEQTLSRGLRQKSLTTVRNALEFRMNESAANRTAKFRVSVLYQGRDVGQQTLQVKTRFQVDVAIAEEIALKDGIPTQVKVRLTNQSQKATDSVLAIQFVSDPKKLVIANPTQRMEALNPGESRIVEFTVTAHTTESVVSIPLALSVTGAGNRRVGLLDMTSQVPVINDYRVVLSSNAQSLTTAGLTRAYYRVTNTGSRLLLKGLTLKVRFKDTDKADNFVVIGPNPQFLMPLEKGETVQFVLPILVKESNNGGTLELTLEEDGHTVVIHDANFKKNLN